MTKAVTQGEKRRRKVTRATERAQDWQCAISGVKIAASPQPVESNNDEALRKSALLWCAIMGWPFDPEHMKLTRDQRIATLYGRLRLMGRISEDACLAMREYEALAVRYKREVLGTVRVVEDYPSNNAEPLEDRIRALTNHWMDAQGVIGSWSTPIREQFHRALAECRTPPSAISDAQAKCVEVVAHALARHFGIRA